MNRHWLLTWTAYGNWLPGDARGFVGNILEDDGNRVSHNIPGTPYEADLPKLSNWIKDRMNGPPVALGVVDAKSLVEQYQETALIRQWTLQAASIMFNHIHLVLETPHEADPQLVLETFKNWSTRALKKRRPVPANGSFWTVNGSKRKLPTEEAIQSAVVYVVKKQPNPLAVWHSPTWQSLLDGFDAAQRAVTLDE
ncbi:transposase [Zavarzinella formosa]|uniref:transposase n=1 Tax=Zavarzinella formosa TaxID=360055 RepID=UPI0003624D94|nr:transposase [Zavarzinella formosa]